MDLYKMHDRLDIEDWVGTPWRFDPDNMWVDDATYELRKAPNGEHTGRFVDPLTHREV
jgi:hypothetical protein